MLSSNQGLNVSDLKTIKNLLEIKINSLENELKTERYSLEMESIAEEVMEYTRVLEKVDNEFNILNKVELK